MEGIVILFKVIALLFVMFGVPTLVIMVVVGLLMYLTELIVPWLATIVLIVVLPGRYYQLVCWAPHRRCYFPLSKEVRAKSKEEAAKKLGVLLRDGRCEVIRVD